MKYCLAKHALYYFQLQIFTMIFFTAHNYKTVVIKKIASIENNYEPGFHAPLDLLLGESHFINLTWIK